MSCPAEHELAELAQGVLDPEAIAALEQHLDGCDACRRRLALAAAGAERTPVGPRPPEAATPFTFERGARLGRYVLVNRLGRGGAGVVLRAYDPQLDRSVALKVLDCTTLPGPSGRARIDPSLEEARAAARLLHPNVVAVYDVGREAGRTFVAMELVEGGTLASWLKEAPRGPRETLEVFCAAGEGLAAAHRAGLVHRDFKPENVLMGKADARPRVTDFGIALLSQPPPPRKDRLGPGAPNPATLAAAGTLAFMAPEQREGRADARSDQYAFCVSLWKALSGVHPFAHGGASSGALPSGTLPRGVPSRARAALIRGLSYRAEERLASMEALMAELRPRPLAARRWLAAAGLAALLATALSVFFVVQGRRARCEALADFGSLWGPGERAATRAAFAASGRGYAAQSFADFDVFLTGWGAVLTGAQRAACRAERAEEASLRDECLRRARRESAALVAQAVHADATFVDHAAQAARALPLLEACDDRGVVRQELLPPADPATRQQVQALRDQLADAKAKLHAGSWAEARRLATDLAASAEATGHAPPWAEALLLRGISEAQAGADTAAEATLLKAQAVADGAGLDRLRAAATTELGRLVGGTLRRPAEGLAWLALAQGAAERAGSPPDLVADVVRSRGEIDFVRADFAGAVQGARAAAALYERMGPRGAVNLAQALAVLAVVEASRGRIAEAEAAARQALAVGGPAFPPGHPARFEAQSSLAVARMRAGDSEGAAAQLDALATEIEAALGPSHSDAIYSRVLQAYALEALTRPAEAEALLRKALSAAEPGYPKRFAIHRRLGDVLLDLGEPAQALGHAEEAWRLQEGRARNAFEDGATLGGLARALVASGRAQEGIERASQALAVLEGKGAPASLRTAKALLARGQALVALGRAAEAVPDLQAALGGVPGNEYHLLRAEVRFALSRALAAKDPARAKAVAREALADLARVAFRPAWSKALEAAAR